MAAIKRERYSESTTRPIRRFYVRYQYLANTRLANLLMAGHTHKDSIKGYSCARAKDGAWPATFDDYLKFNFACAP